MKNGAKLTEKYCFKLHLPWTEVNLHDVDSEDDCQDKNI